MPCLSHTHSSMSQFYPKGFSIMHKPSLPSAELSSQIRFLYVQHFFPRFKAFILESLQVLFKAELVKDGLHVGHEAKRSGAPSAPSNDPTTRMAMARTEFYAP